MQVYLPRDFDRSTMYDLLSQVIDHEMVPRDQDIDFNFSTLRFIKPVGVTVLSNVVEWLLKKGVRVSFSDFHYRNDVDSTRDPISFLDDSLFFQRYLNQKVNQFSHPRPTTIPLEMVTYGNSLQWLDTKLIGWLSERLSLTRQSFSNIKVCFEEIFNNIKDHSQENIGCIFAQHFPRWEPGIIRIAVSDFGVGIPVTMSKKYPSYTDQEAIYWASELGVSSMSTPQNRGAGLGVLINNVVLHNQGSVHIHSNHGILNCTFHNGQVYKQGINSQNFYPGTLIEIEFRTDMIENVTDDEEDFEW